MFCYSLATKRKSGELFFLEIAPELFSQSSFTLDNAPRAFEKFPVLILRDAVQPSPPSVLTRPCAIVIRCHGKRSSSSKVLTRRLEIALVASQDRGETITWPVGDAQAVLTEPRTIPAWGAGSPPALPEAHAGEKV